MSSSSHPPSVSSSLAHGKDDMGSAKHGAAAKPVIMDKNGLPKRKRKQLVACDSCRLRRVRCDKADCGTGDCSECSKKAIRCTDTYVKTKPRIVRTGKLIAQAKILFGNGEGPSSMKASESPELSPTGVAFPAYAQGSPAGLHPSLNNQQVIRAAEARFVNGELARAISVHLIETYRDVVQVLSPVIAWDHFEKNWEAAGRNAEAMSPTGECLCLVMQAWAARFSDHKSILGPTAPSFADLKQYPGRDFTAYGEAREGFARAMAERALRTIDKRGILRRASGASCAALVMLEFLITWGDTYRSNGRHLMVAAVEHLRSINDGITDDPTEGPEIQDRISGGTLFWMTYTRDAISSAFGSRSTCLSSDDLEVLCELLVNPITADTLSHVSSSDPRTLTGLAVLAIFRHITSLIRTFPARVAGPLPRRMRLNETAVRELWRDLDESSHFSAVFHDSIIKARWVSTPKYDVWFRDLAAMRAQLSYPIHRNICERLVAEQVSTVPRDLAYQHYLEMLERLKAESDLRFLNTSREMAEVVRNYGTNLVHGAAMSVENMSVFLAHMLAMPVWEQGGPEIWPLAAKQEEVGWLIGGLKMMGWCWPDYKRHILTAEQALVHLAAQAEAARPRASASASVSPPAGLHPYPGSDLVQHQRQHQPLYVSSSSYQYTGDTLDQAQHQMYAPPQTATDNWQPTYSTPPLAYSPSTFADARYTYDGTDRSGTSSGGAPSQQQIHTNGYLATDVEPSRVIPQYYDPPAMGSPSMPSYLRYGTTNYTEEQR